jgi:hypothetical protein
VARARLASFVAFTLLTACGAPERPVAKPVDPPEPAAFTAGARMQHFHSTRFGVSIPFPDGPRWRIVDHKIPVMRATHEGTRSVVELAMWHEDELVNRTICETRAHEKGFAKEASGEEVSTEVVQIPEGWDTGIWVGVDRPNERDVTGQLIAFGAFIHKCLYFRFETTTDVAHADVISDRLAFARLRMFGALSLDSFDVPRAPH